MNKENIYKEYPINDTLVGIFWLEEKYDLTSNNSNSISKKLLLENKIEPEPSYVPFIYYNENSNQFEYWSFVYDKVIGYYTKDFNEYNLITYRWETAEYEIIDPDENNSDHTIIPVINDISNNNNIIITKTMHEQIAKYFNPQAYTKGFIFIDNDKLKEFISMLK